MTPGGDDEEVTMETNNTTYSTMMVYTRPERLVPIEVVCERIGCSRTTLTDHLMHQDGFPKPRQQYEGATKLMFVESEIDEWIRFGAKPHPGGRAPVVALQAKARMKAESKRRAK